MEYIIRCYVIVMETLGYPDEILFPYVFLLGRGTFWKMAEQLLCRLRINCVCVSTIHSLKRPGLETTTKCPALDIPFRYRP